MNGPWQRAAPPYVQAVLALRWFEEAADLRILARDARVSIATAYRYLHEAIDAIAEHAPDLHEVLAQGLRDGWACVCLDGTTVPGVSSAWQRGRPADVRPIGWESCVPTDEKEPLLTFVYPS